MYFVPTRDRCYYFKKYIRRKKLALKLALIAKFTDGLYKNWIIPLDFTKKTPFSPKIDQNHSIGPSFDKPRLQVLPR
jgi:hypothetical protein